MPFEEFLSLNLLVPLDVFIYASLIVGTLRKRRSPTPKLKDLGQAFALLDESLWKAFPDLPQGLTLREALARAEGLNLKVDWGRIQLALQKYEAFRFGGGELPENSEEVLKLAAGLRKGVRVGRGP